MAPFKGGIETYSNELIKQLEKFNNINIITYLHPDRPPKSNIHQIRHIFQNRSKDFFNYFFSSIKISFGLKFDVIHAANVIEALPGIVLKFLTGKPLVTSVHDTGFVRANPQWSTFSFLMRKYIRKFVCKMSDKVIVPTENIKNQIVKFLNVDPSNIVAVHYGVDKKLFNPHNKGVLRSKLKIPKETFVLYYCGMLYPKKGLEYAIEALKYVKEKTSNFVFVIDGAEIFLGYEDRLKKLRDDFDLVNKIIFVGLTKDRENWYVDCDAFILPSVDTEGLSVTCLESGASGKPIITTTILEETGAVIRNKTALVVKPKDSKALAEAILKLIEDKSLRKRLSKGSYQYSMNFDWEKTKKETQGIYKEIIGE